MSLINSAVSVTVIGNGIQTVFDYGFIIPAQGDADLWLIDSAGAYALVDPALWLLNNANNPNGGTFQYPYPSGSALPLNSSLVLIRTTPFTQPNALVNQNGYYPAAVEKSLDWLEMQIQQIRHSVDRTIRLPDVATPVDAIATPKSQLEDGIITFDADGNPVLTTGVILPGVPVTPFGAELVALGSFNDLEDLFGFSTFFKTLFDEADSTALLTTVEFTQAGAGAVARSVLGKLREEFSITDFGATAGGSGASNQAAIQAAIDACIAAGGGVVKVPPGVFDIASQIVIAGHGVNFVGYGEGCSVIRSTFANGDVIVFGDGTTQYFNVGFRDLTVDSLGNRASGAAVRVQNCQYWKCERVSIDHIYGQHYIGFSLESYVSAQVGGKYFLDDVEILGTLSDGIGIGTYNGSLEVGALHFKNVVLNTCGLGIRVTSASYLDWTNVECVGSVGHSFLFQPGVGQNVTLGLIRGLTVGGNGTPIGTGGDGVRFEGVGIISDINITDFLVGDCGGSGVVFANTNIDGITMACGRSMHNKLHGYHLFAGVNIILNGVQAFNNSENANNTWDGIHVEPNVTRFIFTGCQSGLGGYYARVGQPNKQRGGIVVAAGTSDFYSMTGNVCVGNVTFSVSDGGTGVNKAVANNV